MTSLRFKNKRDALRSKGSSALIITLVVMVLITLLVVSLSSMVGIERVTAHSSFENEKARQFANMAVDEVLATLKDNIPQSNLWAAAPGHLYVYTGQTNFTSVPLNSGVTSGTSTTGTVNLNAAVIGGSSASTYPIVPTNSEYGTTNIPMNVCWVEVLQDGTNLIRNGVTPAVSPSASDPVVGRYAYWVDVENGKVNINTAGRGQTTYVAATNAASTMSNYCGGSAVGGTTNAANTTWATTDLQNLSGSPSRVDLSQLDGGITTNQSLATFHTTYGGYYAGTSSGDYLNNFNAWVTNANTNPIAIYPKSGTVTGGVAYGMQRFNSIWEWSQMTNDPLITSTSISPITSSQIDQNKFYLTVKSRTPETTPLGLNKMWLQMMAPQLVLASASVVTGSSAYGNIINAKGPSGVLNAGYPLSASVAYSFPPDASPSDYAFLTDTRYYCYPWNTSSVTSIGTTNQIPDGQWLGGNWSGPQNNSTYNNQNFVGYFIKQLSRRDWPGMPSKSFVDKYGQKECEDLAYDILWLYDTTIGMDGPSPSGFNGIGGFDYDPSEHYGKVVPIYTPGSVLPAVTSGRLTNGHLMMPTGAEFPYVNEIAVTFTPTTSGYVANSTFTDTTYTYVGTSPSRTRINAILQTTTTGGAMWSTTGMYTKDGSRPGFVPGIFSTVGTTGTYYLTQAGSGNSYVNVAMKPYIQLYYPPGFKDIFYGYNPTLNYAALNLNAYITDVLVTATGKWTPPPTVAVPHPTQQTVVYGGLNSMNDPAATPPSGNTIPNGQTSNGGSQYYWGFPDDHPNQIPTTANSTHGQVSGQANGLIMNTVSAGASTTPFNFTPGSYQTMTLTTPIYIGPFDSGTQPQISIQFRTTIVARQQNTALTPVEIIPLGFNYGTTNTPTYPAGNYSAGGYKSPASDLYGYTNVLNGTNGYSPTLQFTVNTTNTILSGTSSTTNGPSFTATVGSSTSVAEDYEATDPRVWHYVTDWQVDPNTSAARSSTTGIFPGTSFPSYTNSTTSDPLNPWVSSTTPEDDSKYAYPQSPYNYLAYGQNTIGTRDARWSQFANHITQLPGIGWLSVLPLNVESSQGAPSSSEVTGGSGSSSATGPVPWRTLSLGPVTAGETNLPDWLILEAFAIAYDQTYLSQTDGKMNVNGGNIYPFGFTRTKPMQALIQPASYTTNADNPNLAVTNITTDLASSSFSSDGNYTAVTNWSMPTDAFVYPAQIAQMQSVQATSATSGSAVNQWQRESLLRNILGTITTKCSDFRVHVIAQSVKQISTTNLAVTGEVRMSALVSRESNVGPDDLPVTPDDPSTNWEGTTNLAAYVPFRYVISDIQNVNN